MKRIGLNIDDWGDAESRVGSLARLHETIAEASAAWQSGMLVLTYRRKEGTRALQHISGHEARLQRRRAAGQQNW